MSKRLLPILAATGVLISANPILADDDGRQEVQGERKAEYNDPEYRDKYTPYRAYGGVDDKNGSVHRDTQPGPVNAAKPNQPQKPKAQQGQAPEHKANHVNRKTDEFSRPLAKTSKMRFDELPDAVKRTVREQSGGAKIEDVERGTLDGRTVYEIAFKRGNAHNELRVYENGNVLRRMVTPQK